MPTPSPLLPISWFQGTTDVILEMALDPKVPGAWAWALVGAQGIAEPSVRTLGGMPLLHGTLKAWREEARPVPLPALLVSCPLSLAEEWPEAVGSDTSPLPARERLALWLIAAGADPWVKDASGWDALDWAAESGSRSVFDQLLRHPGCPPRAQLWARTLAAEQSHLPWTHVAANRQRWDWLADLMAAGAHTDALDKRGWPASAWATNEMAVAQLARLGALPKENEGRTLVQRAWIRRAALKLPQSALPLEQMNAAMAEHAPLSAADRRRVQWAQRIEANLAQRCCASYPFRSGPVGLEPPEDLGAYGAASKNFRHEVSRGPTRGRWSPVASIVMAMLTALQDEQTSAMNLAKLERLVNTWSSEDVGRWLDVPIRPGLTPRGMLWWLLRPHVRPSAPQSSGAQVTCGKLMAELDMAQDCLENLSAAVDACLSIAGGKAVGHDRQIITDRQWSAVVTHIPSSSVLAQSDAALQRWADWWEGTPTLDASLEQVAQLRQWCTPRLHSLQKKGGASAAHKGAFALLKALVDGEGRASNGRWHDDMDYIQNRAEDFLLLQKLQRTHPEIGPWFTSFPFSPPALAVLNKRGRSELVQSVHAAWLEMALPNSCLMAGRPRL